MPIDIVDDDGYPLDPERDAALRNEFGASDAELRRIASSSPDAQARADAQSQIRSEREGEREFLRKREEFQREKKRLTAEEFARAFDKLRRQSQESARAAASATGLPSGPSGGGFAQPSQSWGGPASSAAAASGGSTPGLDRLSQAASWDPQNRSVWPSGRGKAEAPAGGTGRAESSSGDRWLEEEKRRLEETARGFREYVAQGLDGLGGAVVEGGERFRREVKSAVGDLGANRDWSAAKYREIRREAEQQLERYSALLKEAEQKSKSAVASGRPSEGPSAKQLDALRGEVKGQRDLVNWAGRGEARSTEHRNRQLDGIISEAAQHTEGLMSSAASLAQGDASGAATSLLGQAAGVAKRMGPVGGAIAAAVGTFVTGVKLFQGASAHFAQRAEQLKDFSGEIATASASRDVRSLLADIKESQFLGGSMSKFIDARADVDEQLREILLPFKEKVIELLVKTLESVGDWLDKYGESLGEGLVKVVQAVDILMEIQSKIRLVAEGPLIKLVKYLAADEENSKEERSEAKAEAEFRRLAESTGRLTVGLFDQALGEFGLDADDVRKRMREVEAGQDLAPVNGVF